MFQKIIIGIDGSDASLRALTLACKLAQASKAELYLVHTPRPDTVAFATGAISGYHMVTTMPADTEIEKAAQSVLDAGKAAAKAVGCTPTRSEVKHGDPGETILTLAKEVEADLIVTGRRGLGNLAGLVLGSTSQRISHLATCAVLTVP